MNDIFMTHPPSQRFPNGISKRHWWVCSSQTSHSDPHWQLLSLRDGWASFPRPLYGMRVLSHPSHMAHKPTFVPRVCGAQSSLSCFIWSIPENARSNCIQDYGQEAAMGEARVAKDKCHRPVKDTQRACLWEPKTHLLCSIGISTEQAIPNFSF